MFLYLLFYYSFAVFKPPNLQGLNIIMIRDAKMKTSREVIIRNFPETLISISYYRFLADKDGNALTVPTQTTPILFNKRNAVGQMVFSIKNKLLQPSEICLLMNEFFSEGILPEVISDLFRNFAYMKQPVIFMYHPRSNWCYRDK